MMKRNILIIFILFSIILTVMTYPLIFKISTVIPGFQNTDETFAVLRHFWWSKYSSAHNLNPQNDFLRACPYGIEQPRTAIQPISLHFSRILSMLTDEIMAYNILIVSNLLLAAIAMYMLVYHLTRNSIASFLSGVIYAFCPYQFARIWQHFLLTFTEWMPLYILALLLLYERRTVKDLILCALAFLAVIGFEYHYAFFMVIASAVFMLYSCFNKKELERPRLLNLYLLLIVLNLVITIIMAFPLLSAIFTKARSTITPSAWSLIRPFEDLFAQSARPLSYFLPSPYHPIFGGFTEKFLGSSLYGTSFTEHVLYLGLTPLFLAFIAFKKRKVFTGGRFKFYINFFLILAVIAWLFSQPPWWNFFGIKIYMPPFLIYKLIPSLRANSRFGILVMLAVAVLAGFGANYITEKLKSKKISCVIVVFCSFLVLFEFFNYPPLKVIDVSRIPKAYDWLSAQSGEFTIAEYPLDTQGEDVRYLFYQTRHHKKIINGTTPGTKANDFIRTITKLSFPSTISALKYLGVKYIFVHRQDYIDSGLIEDRIELKNIEGNHRLKLVKSFPSEECLRKDALCTQKAGTIDIYEIVKEPDKPKE